MPVPKKNPTTSAPGNVTGESSLHALPEQEEFRAYLRRLAISAVQVLLEQVMREELEQCIGASWGECTLTRRGYRNGSYTRDLVTPTGRIEDLKVPRDREGAFQTQVFESYQRHAPEVAEALTEMFVSGVSTHKVGTVAQTLTGVAPSASAVSRLNRTLTEQFEAWRVRPLQAHYRILYLDGVHFTIRHGTQTDSTILLTALGVDLQGNKEVLALRVCAEEDKDGWCCLLQDLRTRGATQLDLIVTDGHEGLLAAVSALFSATPRQHCVVHKQRNVLNAIPHRERKEVGAELAGIFKQEQKDDALLNLTAFKAKYQKRYPEAIRSLCEDEEYLLTFYSFPQVMHRYIRTTNAIESFFSNVRQRTDQIDAFTTETSCLTIVWAVMSDIHLPRIPVS
ncbi:IS256 family transposase [Reticulibacter mediterranei]|uniref:Mutator family transposase n=1 Tax=Reticulibacter mediterranei TaxID=2778369 RepID=A0A8J3IXU4_9CHLR|nr:IS256 family transposase [Reticulibacter mediterranei]GHO98772.1 IS256 family transposase [Reticulibacter mediterranei]